MLSLTVTGDRELQQALDAFIPRLQRKIVRRSARAAARPVLDTARALVPKDERQLERTLKIRALPRSRKNRDVIGVQVRTDRKALEQIHAETPGVFNPHWAEYGAPGHMLWGQVVLPQQATPFMRPAADQNKAKVAGVFQTQLRTEVEEAGREAQA